MLEADTEADTEWTAEEWRIFFLFPPTVFKQTHSGLSSVSYLSVERCTWYGRNHRLWQHTHTYTHTPYSHIGFISTVLTWKQHDSFYREKKKSWTGYCSNPALTTTNTRISLETACFVWLWAEDTARQTRCVFRILVEESKEKAGRF